MPEPLPDEPDDRMLEAAIAPYRYNNTSEFNEQYKQVVRGYWLAMVKAWRKEDSPCTTQSSTSSEPPSS